MSVRATQGGYTLRIDANASGYAFSGFQRLPTMADARYVVWTSGSLYQAMNTATGLVESSGGSGTNVVQYTLNNLSSGRTSKEAIRLIGPFTIGKITVPSYTRIDAKDAKLFLASGTNTHMMSNTDVSGGNTDIELDGGIYDGNRPNNAQGTQEANTMIYFKRCRNVLIHDAKFQNGAEGNVMFRDCYENIFFTNNISRNPLNAHFATHAQDTSGTFRHHFVIGNTFYSDTDPTLGGATYVETLNVDDVVVAGNTCVGASGAQVLPWQSMDFETRLLAIR